MTRIDLEKLLETLETIVCDNDVKYILVHVHTNRLIIKNTIAIEDFSIEHNLESLQLTGKEFELEISNIINITYENDEENICVIKTDNGIIYLDYI